MQGGKEKDLLARRCIPCKTCGDRRGGRQRFLQAIKVVMIPARTVLLAKHPIEFGSQRQFAQKLFHGRLGSQSIPPFRSAKPGADAPVPRAVPAIGSRPPRTYPPS